MAGTAPMIAADEVLERVTQVPGVRGSLLISSTDGLVVAERLMDGIDGRAVAALVASLMQRLGRATAAARLDPPRFVHLRGSSGSVLAAPGSDDVLLVAVVTPDANLGRARLDMLDAIERLS